MLAIPLDELVLVDAGRALRAPDLHRPREDAEVVVGPVVERAGDDLLRVIAEVVIDRDVRIAGDLGALRAELLVGPQVLGGQRVVGLVRVRPQQHAAVGVEEHRAGDVGMRGDELHRRAHLGLGGRKRPGAVLLVLLPPARGEVAIEVEPFLLRGELVRRAVVVLDAALGQQAVVAPAGLGRVAADHQPRIARGHLPRPVGIGHAHGEHAAVAVDVLAHQALDRLLVVRIGARAGADAASARRPAPSSAPSGFRRGHT